MFGSTNIMAVAALATTHIANFAVMGSANMLPTRIHVRDDAQSANLLTDAATAKSEAPAEYHLRSAGIRSLEDGWAGAGSRKIAEASLVQAERALDGFRQLNPYARAPLIVPCPDGSTQIEYHGPEGSFEMYFEVDGEVAAWWSDFANNREFDKTGSDAYNLFWAWTVRPESWATMSIAA
jgi:hypothetical protein